MARSLPYEEYEDYEEVAMPRSGSYGMQNQGNNNNNRGNQQQHQGGKHNQQQGNPKGNPSLQRVQAKQNDRIYQLVTRLKWNPLDFPDETVYAPAETYFIPGQGVVNGSAGFRKAQIVGYAYYDGNGSFIFFDEKDPEYAFINEEIKKFQDFNIDNYRNTYTATKKGSRGSKSNQIVVTKAIIPMFWRIAIIITFLITLYLYIAIRGL